MAPEADPHTLALGVCIFIKKREMSQRTAEQLARKTSLAGRAVIIDIVHEACSVVQLTEGEQNRLEYVSNSLGKEVVSSTFIINVTAQNDGRLGSGRGPRLFSDASDRQRMTGQKRGRDG